ncbi:MAG: alpha/beta hydrolase [Promethearchaeota archaeon]
MKKYQVGLDLAFLACVVVSSIVLNYFPASITRTSQSTFASDGVKVSYNLYYEEGGALGSRPVVIIGHGMLVNKEMMTNFAIELASQGFIVANLDWLGHGHTGAAVDENSSNAKILQAVIDDLPVKMPQANMSDLGMMGYSMGGGPTFQYAKNHSTVKAWVGVATRVDATSNETDPANVLLIIGRFDEAFSIPEQKDNLANFTPGILTGDELVPGTVYGDIDAGTARKMVIVPNADHLNVPWNAMYVREATSWFVQTFKGSGTTIGTFHFYWRSAFVFIGMAGVVGIIYGTSLLLAHQLKIKKEGNARERAGKDTGGREPVVVLPDEFEDEKVGTFLLKYYGFTLLLLPTAFLPGITFLTPLFFTAFLSTLVGCLAINILIFMSRILKKHGKSLKIFLKQNFSAKPKTILFSIILSSVLIVGLYFIVGLNELGMIPPLYRLVYIPVFGTLNFFSFGIYTLFIQKIIGPLIESKLRIKNPRAMFLVKGFLQCLVVYSWFVIIILLMCALMGSLFLVMILTLMVPIFLFFSYLGLFMEQLTRSIIPNAIIQTVLLCFIIMTLSPAGNIMHFFS